MPEIENLPAPAPAKTSRPAVVPGLTAGQFSLFFGLLIFVAFPQVLLGLASFVVRDFGFFAYPLAYYQRECFWRGELPLWNPYNHCGVPFLAQWNTMPLYPPAVLYLVLPLSWSLSFFSLAHLFWAGLGMYMLARRWTGNAFAASVAGLVFGFNGFSLNLLMWPSHIATFSWMPWVVWATECACREGGRKLILAGLVGALQMLAGGPETILFTWLLGGAVWVCIVVQAWRTGANRAWGLPLLRFPVILLLTLALAAIQLLPFLDLVLHSQRETGFADTRWSMPRSGWANLLVPMAFGITGKQGLFFQFNQYWTSSYYLGVAALLLAMLGIRAGARSWRMWLMLAASLLGLILATGDQTVLSRHVRMLIPQLSLITYPVKFVLLAVFGIPLLAASGMVSVQQTAGGRKINVRILSAALVLVALIAGVLVWAWRFPHAGEDVPVTLRNGLSRMAFLAVSAAGLLFLSKPIRAVLEAAPRPSLIPGAAQALGLGLLTIFWADIWTHEPQQNPTVPAWVYQPNLARTKQGLTDAPAVGSSRLMLSPKADTKFKSLVLDTPRDNYLVKRVGFFADCNLLDHVPKVDGFFSLAPRECGELYSALYVSGFSFGTGLLDFLSVSHVIASEENPECSVRTNFLPLITAGQAPIFVEETNALLALLSQNFDPRRNVLVPPEAKELAIAKTNASARVSLRAFSAQEIHFQTEADAPAWVVIAQTYYHPWRAYIDGKPASLFRANYAFQALQAPSGSHEVRLRYEDRAFQTGALVTGAAAALCAVNLGVWLLRRKRIVAPN